MPRLGADATLFYLILLAKANLAARVKATDGAIDLPFMGNT